MTALKLICGDWRAEILPEEGANLSRLTYQGKDVLRSRDSALRAGEGLPLYGSPVLFPANRTRDGLFTFQGHRYRLPVNEPSHRNHLHGMVMKQAFQILEADPHRAVCRYLSRPEHFPLHFSLTVSLFLSQRGLFQKFTLDNLEQTALPVVFGLHTTFFRPDFIRVPLGPALERDERFLPTGATRPLTSVEKRLVQGEPYQDQLLSGVYLSHGQTARIGAFSYQVSELFDHWVLYTGKGGDFVCVEPQAGRVDGLNHPAGHLVVPPGKSLHFTAMISKEERYHE